MDSVLYTFGRCILSVIGLLMSNSRVSGCTLGWLFRFERLLGIEVYLSEESLGHDLLLDGCCFAFQRVRSGRLEYLMKCHPLSHTYTQSFSSCPVLFPLVLKTMLALPLALSSWELACTGKVLF